MREPGDAGSSGAVLSYELQAFSSKAKKLVVAYGPKWSIEWIVVCSDEKILDLMPSAEGLPAAEDDVYQGYSLQTSFRRSLMQGRSSAVVVAEEIRDSFVQRQLVLLEKQERIKRMLLSEKFVQMLKADEAWLVIKKDQSVELMSRLPCRDEEEFPGGVGKNSWPLICISMKPDGTVIQNLITNVPEADKGFDEPHLKDFDNFDSFMESCQEKIQAPRRRRKELSEEVRRRYLMVDLDRIDYSRFSIILNIVQQATPDARKRLLGIYVLTMRFGPDFPQKPPTMSLRDFSISTPSATETLLERHHYKYSPRWHVDRMATELVDHAAHSALALLSGSSPTRPAPAAAATSFANPNPSDSASSFLSAALLPHHSLSGSGATGSNMLPASAAARPL